MTCIEDLTQRLASLGLTPLPAHYNSFLQEICGGNSSEAVANFLYRLHNWPRIVLALSRRYEISDSDYERLQNIFLSSGKGISFQAEVEKLNVHNALAPKIKGDDFDVQAARRRVSEAHRAMEFADYLKMHSTRVGKIPIADDPAVNELRRRYIAGELTVEKLLNSFPKPR
jgi:hypothetical protein